MYHSVMAELTAFVLAGGKSSRMGTNKAFLELDGRTLLSRTMEVAATVAGEVRIVGQPFMFAAYGRTVADAFPERGPLGGIHAALQSSATELNLVLAVDMPFLASNLLRYLVEQAQPSDALVTVPEVGGRLQPLCAVYRKSFSGRAESAIKENRNKIDPLFAPEITRIIAQEELLKAGFTALMFENVNTPEEFENIRTESLQLTTKAERP